MKIHTLATGPKAFLASCLIYLVGSSMIWLFSLSHGSRKWVMLYVTGIRRTICAGNVIQMNALLRNKVETMNCSNYLTIENCNVSALLIPWLPPSYSSMLRTRYIIFWSYSFIREKWLAHSCLHTPWFNAIGLCNCLI